MHTASLRAGRLAGMVLTLVYGAAQAAPATDLECAGCVGSADLAKQVVTTAKLKNGAVTRAKLKNGAVSNTKLAADAVSSDKILDGAVQADDLAPGAVKTSRLVNGAVTTAKLRNGAVTSGKLAADAVTADKIANGAVQTADLASGAVSTGKIANGAVTAKKLSDGAGSGVDADLLDGLQASEIIAAAGGGSQCGQFTMRVPASLYATPQECLTTSTTYSCPNGGTLVGAYMPYFATTFSFVVKRGLPSTATYTSTSVTTTCDSVTHPSDYPTSALENIVLTCCY